MLPAGLPGVVLVILAHLHSLFQATSSCFIAGWDVCQLACRVWCLYVLAHLQPRKTQARPQKPQKLVDEPWDEGGVGWTRWHACCTAPQAPALASAGAPR